MSQSIVPLSRGAIVAASYWTWSAYDDRNLDSNPHSVLQDVRDDMGWTPLHYAAYYKQADIVEALLIRNMDLDVCIIA